MADGSTGGGGTGGTGGTGGSSPVRGRRVYKLGVHKRKTKDETGNTVYVDTPILSRALARVGTLLQLTEASEEDLRTTVEFEGGNAEYWKRGSSMADRIVVVYEAGEGAALKLKTLQVPIPRWAPNYKVVGLLAQKARAAGLRLRGLRRHGFLIQPPSGAGGGAGGGTGGGTGGGAGGG